MSSDPSINVVVFAVNLNGKMEHLAGEGSTKSPNCVATVWENLQKQHHLAERNIVEIYSEWQPSSTDLSFIEQHFPNVKVSYSFERPSDDHWDSAMAKVKRIVEEAQAKQVLENARQEAKNSSPLPILRNADGFSEMVVNIPFIPELSLFLANVGMTPRGTIGIDYMMLGKVKDEGINITQLWTQAFANLTNGLSVNVAKQNGHPYFILRHATGIAASAIGLPDFPGNAEKWVGTRRIILAIPQPGMLIICAANSKAVRHIQDTTLKSPYVGSINLTPCVLLLNEGKFSLMAKRKIK